MSTRVVAAFAATLILSAPVSAAFAQAEHAQRVAIELAQRRAQMRAALCQQQEQLDAAALRGQRAAVVALPPLPTSPPVGTGGPVPVPAKCASR